MEVQVSKIFLSIQNQQKRSTAGWSATLVTRAAS